MFHLIDAMPAVANNNGNTLLSKSFNLHTRIALQRRGQCEADAISAVVGTWLTSITISTSVYVGQRFSTFITFRQCRYCGSRLICFWFHA